MVLGWVTGSIGGIIPRESFKHSFGLDRTPEQYAVSTDATLTTVLLKPGTKELSGWIVSTMQIGGALGALLTAFTSDRE